MRFKKGENHEITKITLIKIRFFKFPNGRRQMKRSEMIDILVSELTEILAAEKTKTPHYHINDFIKNKASGILDLIEGLGMQPPEHCDPLKGDHMDFYYINEWESE